MKVIATFPDLASAEVAKSVLEARDIPAWIPDANLAGLDWRMGTAIGGVRLQVDDQHAEAAAELLVAESPLEADSETGELDADEVCPHCKSTHIGPDDQRRLKMLTLLFFPAALVTMPMILMARGRVRCGDCQKTWRQLPAG
jgi:hypothetical protein